MAVKGLEPRHTLKHELHAFPLVCPQPLDQHVVDQHGLAFLTLTYEQQRPQHVISSPTRILQEWVCRVHTGQDIRLRGQSDRAAWPRPAWPAVHDQVT